MGFDLDDFEYSAAVFAHTDNMLSESSRIMHYYASSPTPTPVAIYDTDSAVIYIFIDANHALIDTGSANMDTFYPRLVLHENEVTHQ